MPSARGAGREVYCVVGMHRSGTSVVARMLNLLGVSLGPEEALMGPKPENPKGFWEHKELSDLSEDLLVRLGGTWDAPPALRPGWERDRGLEDIRKRAVEILRRDFGEVSPWGWKDPRASMLLPFWQDLLPSMRYLLCVRNPLDAARSLERRNDMPLDRGLDLWLRYQSAAVRNTSGAPRLVVVFEDVLRDPRRELRRLAAFVGGEEKAVTPELGQAVGEFVSGDLRHHSAGFEEMLEAPLGLRITALYAAFLLAAGGSDREREADRLLDLLAAREETQRP